MKRLLALVLLLLFISPLVACNLSGSQKEDPSYLRNISQIDFEFDPETSKIDIKNAPKEGNFFYAHPLHYFAYTSYLFTSGQLKFTEHHKTLDNFIVNDDFEAFEAHLPKAQAEIKAYATLVRSLRGYGDDTSLRDEYLNLLQADVGTFDSLNIVKGFVEQAGGWNSVPKDLMENIQQLRGSTDVIFDKAINNTMHAQEVFLLKYAEEIKPLIDDSADVRRLEQMAARSLDIPEMLNLEGVELSFPSAPSSSLDVTQKLVYVFNAETQTLEIENLPENVDYFYANPLDYEYYLDNMFTSFVNVWKGAFEDVVNAINAGEFAEAKSQFESLGFKIKAYQKVFDDFEGYKDDTTLRDTYLKSVEDYREVYEKYATEYFETVIEVEGLDNLDRSQTFSLKIITALIGKSVSDILERTSEAHRNFKRKYTKEIRELFLEY